MPLTENLDVFSADFGVPVCFAGSRAGLKGVEDFADQPMLEDGGSAVMGRVRVVVIPTADVCELKHDDEIKVGGTWRKVGDVQAIEGAKSYTVVRVQAIDDGAFTMIQLARA